MGTLKQVRKLRERWDRELAAYWREQEELRRRMQEELARRQARQRAIDEQIRLQRLRPFPPPPLPGTKDIVPICRGRDLVEEGRKQANCVGSYDSRVKDGKYYVYQVLSPQRATLAIVQSADSNWRIDELKTRGNNQASKETLGAVNAWLSQYRISV